MRTNCHYTTDFKVQHVKLCLSVKASPEDYAKAQSIHPTTFGRWIDQYKAYGETGLERKAPRRKIFKEQTPLFETTGVEALVSRVSALEIMVKSLHSTVQQMATIISEQEGPFGE